MFFFSAVWLFFYRLFITDQQVGFLDAMAFAIGLVAEVPSGALADKYGRARMVRVGLLLVVIGIVTQAANSSFMPFFVGQAVMMIGFAFVSGADDALFFDKLRYEQDSPEWRKLVTKGSQATLIAGLVATLAGGYLHTLQPRLPWFLTALAVFVSAIVIWPIKDDPKNRDKVHITKAVKEYAASIAAGFAAFKAPKLRVYVLFILTVQGLFYVNGFGLLKPIFIDRFGYSPFWGSAVLAGCSLFTVGILAYMHKHAARLSEKRVLVTIALSAACALLFAVGPIGYFGGIVLFVLYAGEHVLHPFMSETVNYHTNEEQRATVLSVASFLKSLPYVLLAPLIGYLNTRAKLHYFLLAWSVLVLFSVGLYLKNKRKDSLIHLA
jgi:MFS family permease